MLPRMIHNDNISKWRTVRFGGINHTLGAETGDIWLDENIVSDEYPVLVTRPARKIQADYYGIYGTLGDIQIGQNIKYKGVTVTGASFSELQSITEFNRYALLMPSKVWVRTDIIGFVASTDDLPEHPEYGDVWAVGSEGEYSCVYWDGDSWEDVGAVCGSIEASETVSATFADGTYAGEAADANTILAADPDFDWSESFSVGDAVKISGAADDANNITIIVREIDGNELRFYENSFTVNSTPANITIAREMPDLDMICVNENRVWGYHRQTIYASKLGDFRNWNVFDGLSSDSYAVDVLAGGDFTGCITFLGYPTFFKVDGVYKVYGARPANFQVMGSAATGVLNGATLAIAGETLYYLSRDGVMAYSGGMPLPVSDMLGDIITGSASARAASDGHKYRLWYDSAKWLEWDDRKSMWHIESIDGWDGIAYGFVKDGKIALVSTSGELWSDEGMDETVSWYMETADWTEDVSDAPQYGANKKGTGKVQLRMVLGEYSTCTVSMQFDSDGVWREVKSFRTENVKRSFYLPIIPRRNDHFRIRIEGTGHYELYSLSRESYKGSAI